MELKSKIENYYRYSNPVQRIIIININTKKIDNGKKIIIVLWKKSFKILMNKQNFLL